MKIIILKIRFKVSIIFDNMSQYTVKPIILQSMQVGAKQVFLSRFDEKEDLSINTYEILCNARATYCIKINLISNYIEIFFDK